jgi:ADP-ribose pyrophosphatase
MSVMVADGALEPRAQRYVALREERPDLFVGGGPVALDPERHESTCGVVHADPWVMMVVDPVVMPDGRLGRYGRLVTTIDAEGVAVLPVTADGRVLLLRHWRHATQSWHLEIPRGFGEIGASSERQAEAELSEELDVSGVMVPLGHLHPDTGMLASRVALFAARVAADARPAHREGLASVVEMTTAHFEDAILDGQVTDPFAICAWTRLTLRRFRETASSS